MQDWMIVAGITFLYLIFVLVVGIKAKNDNSKSSLEGYVADGRGIGLFVLFFIMGAEIFSAFAFLGGPGWSYSKGMPAMYIFGYLALGLLPWWVLGPKTARLGKKYGYLTQAELVADRFKSKTLSGIMAIVSVGAFIPYLTTQIKGAGFLFEASTGGNIPFWLGALIAFGVMAVYVFTSGIRGIGWTNVIQGIMMVIIAWVTGLAIANKYYGGVQSMFEEIAQRAPDYLTLPGHNGAMSFAAFSSAIVVSIIGFTMWPHLFNKSYGADNERTIKKTIILYPLYGYLLIPLFIVGFAGILVFQDTPLEQADTVLIELVNRAGFSPIFVGLLLSGALAAAMSSGANIVHTAASVIIKDFYVKLFNPKASEETLVKYVKFSVLAISLISYLFALNTPASLVQLLLVAYGGVVQFFPLIIALFFWKRATTFGAFLGLITGTLVTVYFSFFAAPWFDIHAGIWGLIFNSILLVIGSYLTKPMDEKHVNRFVEDSKIPLEKMDDHTSYHPEIDING